MSDDDEYLMDEAGDEDYDFDYEEDDDQEADAGIENKYYNAKGLKEDDADAAIKEFQAVVEQEGNDKGDWGFKALKQQTKINFHRGKHSEALKTYTELLSYTKSAVTRNYSEKTINNILDYVSIGQGVPLSTMESFYSVTKKTLEESKNERLSVKTDLKLARLWLERSEWNRLNKTLISLKQYCTNEDGVDDQSKGTTLLEIYALEIQMYGQLNNFKKLKETYNSADNVKNAIPHPRITGIIRECGGKMFMSEKNWTKAQQAFFNSFLSYDEAGSPQRIQVLKYLVLAHMLMGSDIDPFDSQETKPYRENPQIAAMTLLVGAYQRREVHEAEKILRDNRATIMDDAFIADHIEDLLRSLRTQYLIDLVQQYKRVELSFLGRQLNISVPSVEDLLLVLILDGRVNGRIDAEKQILVLDRNQNICTRRYQALDKWSSELNNMSNSVWEKHGKGLGGGNVAERGDRMAGMMGMGSMGMPMGMPTGGGFGFGMMR